MKTLAAQVIQFLENIAPLHLQETYDNSGLLIGERHAEITGILVCLDCTEDVIDEAVRLGCNMIISHHPPIFYGIKKLTNSNPTERIIRKAILNDLILYAIHTNLDNVLTHGVNERIAKVLGLNIRGVLRAVTGTERAGAGLLGSFAEPMSEVTFLQLLRDQMASQVIRHTRLLDVPVQHVAVCGGSGSFLLDDAKKAGVQALVTADYKYHGFFEADGALLVCDIGHYESEHHTIRQLQELISGNFTTFAAHCTAINTNPVHYFT